MYDAVVELVRLQDALVVFRNGGDNISLGMMYENKTMIEDFSNNIRRKVRL